MRHFFKAGIFLLIIVGIACNPINFIKKKIGEIQVVAVPDKMEVHGETVKYSLKGKIPSKVFHKKAYVTLTPILKYGGNSVSLPSLKLRGEKTTGEGKVISLKDGGAFSLEGSFDYKPEMGGNETILELEIKVCRTADGTGECATFTKENLARGVINTSKMVRSDELIFVGTELVSPGTKVFGGNFGELSAKFQRSIYFLINSWAIRSTEVKSQRMGELMGFVQTPRIQLQGIAINSFASPDGELRLNQDLTVKRSESTYKLLMDEMKRLKLVSLESQDLYKKQSLEEDWNGFRKLVMESNLEDKAAILQIIDSKQSNDEKEAAVKKMASWPTMLKDMMPMLRRSDMILNGKILNRTLAELKEAAKTSMDDFNTKELLIYAAGVEDFNEKIKAYKAFTVKRPKSYLGYNNLAAIYIMSNKMSDAKTALDNGKTNAKDNDSLYNNYGVVYKAEGNYEMAMQCYDRAAKAGIATGYNKSIINIMQGSYDEAVANIPPAMCGFNASLAQLLKGNLADAVAKIDCAKNVDAQMHYLKAIALARKGEVDGMAASLRKAVEMDSKYADDATKNLEFSSYWQRDEFKNAINR